MMPKIYVVYGTVAEYKALSVKDQNTLYFLDNGTVFKGTKAYGHDIKTVDALPKKTEATLSTIYVLPDYSMYFFDGLDWNTVNVGLVSAIDGDSSTNDGKGVTQGALKAYLAALNVTSDGVVDSKIATAKQEAIDAAAADATTKANAAQAAAIAAAREEINAATAAVYRYKGKKTDVTGLNDIENPVVGDVWHITNASKEYVYDGENWELLGFTIDLSGYSTTEQVTAAINAKAAEIMGSIATLRSDYEAAVAAARTYAEEQAADALQDAKDYTDAQIAALRTESASNASETAQVAAAAAEQAAKTYTDSVAAGLTSDIATAKSQANAYADGLNAAMDTRMTGVETQLTWGSFGGSSSSGGSGSDSSSSGSGSGTADAGSGSGSTSGGGGNLDGSE